MTYGLPASVEINGNDYEIRSDYRAILDILEAINDPELTDRDRAEAVLRIFYPQFEEMPQRDYERAIDRLIELDFTDMYKKVTRTVNQEPETT